MKTEITKNDKWAIVGLLTLAAQNNKQMVEIQNALRNITGEESDIGYCSDAIYSNYTADELIKRLHLKVKE